jgi:type III secretion control protein HpaP
MSRTDSTPRSATRVTTPRTGDGAPPGDAALADRFRRVLGGARRDTAPGPRDELPPAMTALPAAAPEVPAVPTGPQGPLVLPVPDAMDDERPAAPRPATPCAAPEADEAAQPAAPTAPAEPTPMPADAPRLAPWAWARQGGREGGAQERETPLDELASAIDAAPEPAWLRDTADFVGSLCAGIDAGFQTWRMTVPLDARQLPETQLELSLSPHTLCLRFRAVSPESARLVLRYRQQLLDLLSQVPGLPTHIDIELD